MSWLSPLAIRFTHAEISSAFHDGRGLDATIGKFRSNELSAEHFRDVPLEVVCKDGFLWSLNNRRLYVFRVAHAFGCCSVCPCYITPRDLPSTNTVTHRWTDALTSTTNGKLVNVRGGSQYQDLQLGHPVNEEAAARLQLPTIDQFMRKTKAHMGITDADLKIHQDSLEKEGFTSLCSLFDLAYYSADELHKFHFPIRLRRCICELLASPEPFDFVNRQAQAGETSGWGQPQWQESNEPEGHQAYSAHTYAPEKWTAAHWSSGQGKPWQEAQEQPQQQWQQQELWHQQEQWQHQGQEQWQHQQQEQWQHQQPEQWQHQEQEQWQHQQQEQWQHQQQEQWQHQGQEQWQHQEQDPLRLQWQQCQSWQPWHALEHGNSSGQSIAASLWLNQGTDNHAPEMPVCSMQLDAETAREYVEDFCRRRELTRAAKRDLDSLDASVAYDLVHSLEVDKKGISLKPEEWSRILSSRVATKATAGELDQTSIERIDSLMQAVMKAQILSHEAIHELRSTLRNLDPPQLEDVLYDRNFTERVPYGTIENPAAFVHRMAMKSRRSEVEKSIPGYVEGWRYSNDTERALRELCTVNPNRTKRLMEMHKVSRGEASLLWDIQAVAAQ
eukprot:symbB.v1.2.035995.t1/scaffold4979.1/size32168/1